MHEGSTTATMTAHSLKLWLPLGLALAALIVVAAIVVSRPATGVLYARCSSDDECPAELVCGPRSSLDGAHGSHLPYCVPSCRERSCPANHRCYMGACYRRCESNDSCGDEMRCVSEIGCLPRSSSSAPR